MFRSCFVARVAVEKSRAVELFCTFDDPQQVTGSSNGLPPAQALGGFCFPLGPDNVTPKEYMAPEVPAHVAKLDQYPYERGAWLNCAMFLQEYSFTLTAGDGSRLHGFCRQARSSCVAALIPACCVLTTNTPHAEVSCLRDRLPQWAEAAAACDTLKCFAS